MIFCSIVSVDMPECPKCGRSLWRLDVVGPATALLPCGHAVPPDTVESEGTRTEPREVNA
jgi:hypothetical protein